MSKVERNLTEKNMQIEFFADIDSGRFQLWVDVISERRRLKTSVIIKKKMDLNIQTIGCELGQVDYLENQGDLLVSQNLKVENCWLMRIIKLETLKWISKKHFESRDFSEDIIKFITRC